MLCSIGVEYSIGIYNTHVDYVNNQYTPTNGFGKLIASINGPKGQALHVAYCSGIGNTTSNNYCFATCGEKHVTFWNLSGSHKGMKIKEDKGSLGSANRSKTYLSLARLADDQIIVGTTDGDLMCFNSKRILLPVSSSSNGGHTGSVNTLWVNSTGTLLLSGSSDCTVIAWTIPSSANITTNTNGKGKNMESPHLLPIKISFFKLSENLMNSVCPSIPSDNASIRTKELSVRSVCMSPDGNKIIMGTQGCQVLECSTPSSFNNTGNNTTTNTNNTTSTTVLEVIPILSELRLIVTGHYKKELWGLDIRPPKGGNTSDANSGDSEFCTVGDDCYLRVWSVQKKKMLRSIYLGAPAR